MTGDCSSRLALNRAGLVQRQRWRAVDDAGLPTLGRFAISALSRGRRDALALYLKYRV